jgi:N-acetylmuramoyl-L-alanine amidase
MYKKLSIPGVLIECGFFSNPNEFKLLINDTYQNRIVDCIIDGLINYY